MNLHIVDDEKFIDGAINIFEKYSPNSNIFIVNAPSDKFKYVIKRKEVSILNLSKNRNLKKMFFIIENNNVKKIFIHYLSPIKAFFSNSIKRKYNVPTYWIFYGADLYNMLQRDFGYQLQDIELKKKLSLSHLLRQKSSLIKFYIFHGESQKQSILRFIRTLDYFCFWNYYDYELLKKHYETNAEFLDFTYFNNRTVGDNGRKLISKIDLKVIVNNSASITGNHLTILKKIHEIDSEKKISEIIVPLSYGNKKIIDSTIEAGRTLFSQRFNPLLQFIDQKSYFNLLNEVSIAFFGARRQEAGGNIFQLLGTGAKVFLRNDNNMIKYLRDKDFIVFSFEDNFKSIKDLEPLSKDQMLHNQARCNSMFNEDQERLIMKRIISC